MQLPDYPITRLPDDRGASAIGRAARLRLVFEARNGKTYVAHSYVEPPFRIGRSFDVDGSAYVILVCSGPGVFAGDELELSVDVRAGARVMLTSQSALQVHPSACRTPAVIRHRYVVDDGAELQAHWDPVIPFADARLDQRFELEVCAGARLYWGDALMSGRVSRKETWRFDSLTHELRLRIGKTVKYLERYRLRPKEGWTAHRWAAGDSDYAATALTYHERATGDVAECVQRAMQPARDEAIRAAVDLVEPGVLVGRLLGSRGASFARARGAYHQIVTQAIFDRPLQVFRK